MFSRARGELGFVRLEEAELRRRRSRARCGALRYFKGRGRRLLEALEQRTPETDGGRHNTRSLVGALAEQNRTSDEHLAVPKYPAVRLQSTPIADKCRRRIVHAHARAASPPMFSRDGPSPELRHNPPNKVGCVLATTRVKSFRDMRSANFSSLQSSFGVGEGRRVA